MADEEVELMQRVGLDLYAPYRAWWVGGFVFRDYYYCSQSWPTYLFREFLLVLSTPSCCGGLL